MIAFRKWHFSHRIAAQIIWDVLSGAASLVLAGVFIYLTFSTFARLSGCRVEPMPAPTAGADLPINPR